MSTTLWTLIWVLAGMLLAYTTYAAVIGIAGAFAGRSYERCPLCHHHYLAGRGQPVHACPHGIDERVYQTGWALLHHHADAGGERSGSVGSRPALRDASHAGQR